MEKVAPLPANEDAPATDPWERMARIAGTLRRDPSALPRVVEKILAEGWPDAAAMCEAARRIAAVGGNGDGGGVGR